MRRKRRRALLGALLPVAAAGFLVGQATPAAAHPLGNFTTNTSANLRIGLDQATVDYVVDLAEIPAFQARERIDVSGDGDLDEAETERYATAECRELAEGIRLAADERRVMLSATSARVTFPPGQAGLTTMRLECSLAGAMARLDGTTELTFADSNLGGRIGWREITAVGDGTTLVSSDVPERSISSALTAYPEDRLSSPLRQESASLTVRPGGEAADVDPAGGELTGVLRPAVDSFAALVARQDLTVGFALLALAVAFALGAVHALAPGHGKTVMAAYLVGQRGARRQALVLGLTVALTHTGGVFALAVAVTNSSIAPDRLYPWLAGASGLMVAGIGALLVTRALRFRRDGALGLGHHHHPHPHAHAHPHPHPHPHPPLHPHDTQPQPAVQAFALAHAHAPARVVDPDRLPDPDHAHGPDHAHDPDPDPDHGPTPATPLARRSLVAMGFAGGLVPSPSALVVLIGAIALGRAWFGLLLITVYGLGMAATLVGAGLVLSRARDRLERVLLERRRPRLVWLAGALPVITATLVLFGGLLLTARAAGV